MEGLLTVVDGVEGWKHEVKRQTAVKGQGARAGEIPEDSVDFKWNEEQSQGRLLLYSSHVVDEKFHETWWFPLSSLSRWIFKLDVPPTQRGISTT